MNRLLSFLSSALLLCACGGGGSDLVMKGKFGHLNEGEFYIFSTHPAWQGFDTVHIADGAFEYHCSLSDTMVLTMQFPNYMQMNVVGEPGGKISIKGDANNLLAAKISGSDDNDLLTSFRRSIIGKNPGEQTAEAETFIKEHPASMAAEALLRKYFLEVEKVDYDQIAKLLPMMAKVTPWRTSTRQLNASYSALLRSRKGRKMPSLKAVTLSGDTISEKTLQGKPSVVWYWSTWTGDMEQPVISSRKSLRQWLKDINVVSVCLDTDTAGLVKRLKRDSVPGYKFCDMQGWKSPLVTKLGIHSVPSAILIDKDGKILARDLTETALLEELKKLLPNNKEE